MFHQPTWRLRHQLILLAGIALLPIALAGAWGIAALVEQRLRETESAAIKLSRALAAAIDTELNGTISALRALSYSSALAGADVERFYQVAREAVTVHPGWFGVALSDADGRLLFMTPIPYGSREARVLDSDGLQHAIRNQAPMVGSVMASKIAPHWIPVRVPVFRDGELAYILSAGLKADRIADIVRRQNVPSSWVISIYDASDRLVARSRNPESTVSGRASPSMVALMQSGSEGVGTVRTLEGDEKVTGYNRLREHGWTVAVGMPRGELRSELSRTVALYGVGLLVSLGLVVGIVTLVSRRIVDGIGEVRDQALRLGQGLPVESVNSRIEELRAVGQALSAASGERMLIEQERQALLASLREALGRAEDAGRAKDQFLAMLGHELRNPLGPIVAALHLMELKGDTATEREREIMSRQVEHLRHLVDDLLDVGRIVRGKLALRSEPVCLDAVIERALEAVEAEARKTPNGIRIERSARPVWVMGDETRLVQVVINLLSNAMRFDASGQISCEISSDGDVAQISVQDCGVGMDEHELARVFEPFYQAPQSIERAAGGLGLGLAIVHSIVQAHGGTVRAGSPGVGKGCRFELRLPAIAPPEGKREAIMKASAGRSGHILIVDDNVDAAEAVGAALEIGGHQVRIAHRPQQALKLIGEFAPEVAILDIGLPGMDGFQLAAEIRRQHPQWRGKLVALTGYGQDADREKSGKAGFAMHLTKPAEIRDLLAALDELLAAVAQYLIICSKWRPLISPTPACAGIGVSGDGHFRDCSLSRAVLAAGESG